MTSGGRLDALFAVLLALNLTQQARGQCDVQELGKLVAPDAAPGDYFGCSVAIDADTVVIGAYGDDYNGETADSGSAYVFVRTGSVWTQQAWLGDLQGGDFDWFGYSVALDGDTAVIGAYLHDPGNLADAGAAYVFVRSGGVWTRQAKLTAADAADEDWFGYSVALAGDTAVIGAHQSDLPGKTDAGAAYIFVRSGSAWAQQAKLSSTEAAASDYFGRSVAISGETAVIGANGVDLGTSGSAGAAYVFVRSGGIWSQQAGLSASDAAAFDNFGFSVALNVDTAVIGSIFDDHTGGSNAGSAYVFFRSGGVWSQQAKLTASDAASSDSLGRAVTLSGDAAVIGAHQDDHAGGSNAGSAYLFVRSAGSWAQGAKFIASDSASSDFFGSSVGMDGATVAIGSAFDDHAGGNDAGSTYVFEWSCIPSPSIPASSTWGLAILGLAIASIGTAVAGRGERGNRRCVSPEA